MTTKTTTKKKTPAKDALSPRALPAYKPTCTPLGYDKGSKYPPIIGSNPAKWGGFDPKTNAVVPFKIITSDDRIGSLQEYLDNMTVAIEAGVVFSETFVLDFFGTEKKAHAFADLLADEYPEFWVNDRHFNALQSALGSNEDDCATYAGLAEVFRDKASEEAQEKAEQAREKKKRS